jgi:hypothetical protein
MAMVIAAPLHWWVLRLGLTAISMAHVPLPGDCPTNVVTRAKAEEAEVGEARQTLGDTSNKHHQGVRNKYK